MLERVREAHHVERSRLVAGVEQISGLHAVESRGVGCPHRSLVELDPMTAPTGVFEGEQHRARPAADVQQVTGRSRRKRGDAGRSQTREQALAPAVAARDRGAGERRHGRRRVAVVLRRPGSRRRGPPAAAPCGEAARSAPHHREPARAGRSGDRRPRRTVAAPLAPHRSQITRSSNGGPDPGAASVDHHALGAQRAQTRELAPQEAGRFSGSVAVPATSSRGGR